MELICIQLKLTILFRVTSIVIFSVLISWALNLCYFYEQMQQDSFYGYRALHLQLVLRYDKYFLSHTCGHFPSKAYSLLKYKQKLLFCAQWLKNFHVGNTENSQWVVRRLNGSVAIGPCRHHLRFIYVGHLWVVNCSSYNSTYLSFDDFSSIN